MIFLPDSEIFWRQYVHTLTFFLKNKWFYWFHEKTLKHFAYFFQESLAQSFDLEKQAVHAIVAKMIINEELMASMDEPTECMVMHRTEPSRLQSLSLQLADKLAQLVENNERLLELRPGGKIFFFSFEKQLFFARMSWLSYQVKRLEKTCHAYLESSFVYFLNDDYVNSEWPCVTRRARNSWTHCGPRGFMSLKWVESLNSKTYF